MGFLRQFQFGACLADDMGLGKTVETIALLLYDLAERNSGQDLPEKRPIKHHPSLLICPMSIVGNWVREFMRFGSKLSILVHHGHSRKKGEEFSKIVKEYDVIISTYALIHRDLKRFTTVQWNYIILDEAQNIKNHNAKQTQAILVLRGIHKLALTGTPVENRLAELWSIMDFLNPGYLGNVKEFYDNFERPIMKWQDTARRETLQRILQPFILRRLKTDKNIIQDLPEKMESKVYCSISPEQAAIYQALMDAMMGTIAESTGIGRKGKILALLVKLKQVCDHPNLVLKDKGKDVFKGNSGKLVRLEEMLADVVDAKERALVFTQFVGMGTLLQKELRNKLECEVTFLHGSTPQTQRDEMVRKFQESNPIRPAIFILTLKAGGFGLNLTAANHVFHFDRWWNPAVENQATDRTFRIGQKKNVFVHKFICLGTLEEKIDEMLESKRTLAENVIGSGESWLTEMSTEELRSIFTLRGDTITEQECL